jgi:hypothetical protein
MATTTEKRIAFAARLPESQMAWIDQQAEVLGGRAAVLRLLIGQAIENGWTVQAGVSAPEREG